MKKLLFFFSIVFIYGNTISQIKKLSDDAYISILTIGDGASLYDTWGHSAIRVKDKATNLDIVFNYGTYDFKTPNFYPKFIRGQLLYDLTVSPFYRFIRVYIYEDREVKEQVLRLNNTETQAYFDFLVTNVKPENKKYLYDFFFDNCATKLREVTTKVLKDKVNYKDELLNNDSTFRELIYQKLENHPWGAFGIDIALSSIIDKKATAKQTTFLPSYVFDNFANASIVVDGKEVPFVEKTSILYASKNIKEEEKAIFTPILFFSILAFIVLLITLYNYKKQRRTKIVDFIILFSTGLIGLLIVFLWFFTDHKTTANNYNILWAFAPNVIVAFYTFKNKKFLEKYYLLLLLLLLIALMVWLLKIQVFNWAMIPIFVMLFIRYLFNYFYYKNKGV